MFDHKKIEQKWQSFWEKNKTFKTNLLSSKPKYYVLDMFPYPSGSGLHVGHLEGYTATDIIARYKRMNGFEVLHPIGFDAFGLPAEQFAINTGNSPKEFTQKNIDNFRKQLKAMGFSFDYDKEVNTTDPKYFKNTQLIFQKLYKAGLAEQRNVDVNWCPELGTVLANEEVLLVNGKMVSERGEFEVFKKPMLQWVLRITDYAKRLDDGLDKLDFPDSIKALQHNWIGLSKGVDIDFELSNGVNLTVFVNQNIDSNKKYYLVISPEHEIVSKLYKASTKSIIENYVQTSKTLSEIVRLKKRDTFNFVETSLSVKSHPLFKKSVEVIISNKAIATINGGCYFEEKSDKPLKQGISFMEGFEVEKSKETTFNMKKMLPFGKEATKIKLRDWVFARQRYWGEPFPLIHLDDGTIVLDKSLPVTLPELADFKPSKDGQSPLSRAKDWLSVSVEGKSGKRDTNTMPQWAGSCWYYIAYLLKQDDGTYLDLDSPKAKEIINKWLPVDLYVGGQEHAVLHLLYARFWNMFLADQKVFDRQEPWTKLFNQGMILGPDGAKMSKSKGNVINPDDIVGELGADSVRLYEMFMGALDDTKVWSDDLLNSMRKWLERVWRVYSERENDFVTDSSILELEYNTFVSKVTSYIEELKLNMAISEMMIFINHCYKAPKLNKEQMINFLKVLSLFAPHFCEELFSKFSKNSITYEKWPTWDKSKIVAESLTIIVQVNGKLVRKIDVALNATEVAIKKLAKASLKGTKFEDTKVNKTIFVKGKLVNFVV